MADGWDQYPAVGQSSSPASGWDQYPAVEQRSSSSGWNQYPAVEEEERKRRARFVREEPPGPPPKTPGEWMPVYEPPKDPKWSPGQDPEAEGMLATGAREAAHGALPAAGAAAGAMYGAGIGSALGPIGSIGGGLIGAIAGGFGTSAVQEEGLKLLGAGDSIQRAINAKTNPWSAAAGTAVSTAAGFGAGAVPLAARVGSAAISGLGEAGVQAYQGEFDPARLVGSTVAGAALAKPYSWGSRLEAQGAALGERLRPPAAPGGGVHVGDVDLTVKAALDAKIADMAPPPVEAPPAAEPQRPPMTAPAQGRPMGEEPTPQGAPRAPPQPEPPTEYGARPDQEFPTGPNAETAHSLRVGDKVTTDTGDSFVVLNNMQAGNSGDRLIELRWDNGKETAVRASELESTIRPSPYVDAQTGERKLSAAANIERASAAQPSTPREAIEQRAPDETVGGALREAAAARRQDVIRGPEPGAPTSPAAASDTVRFYHGGEDPTSGGGRWLTPNEEYARNFRAAPGQPNQVHYVDIPRERLQGDLAAGYDEINNTHRHFEAPEDIAKQLKPLEGMPGGAGLVPAARQGGGGGAQEPPGGKPLSMDEHLVRATSTYSKDDPFSGMGSKYFQKRVRTGADGKPEFYHLGGHEIIGTYPNAKESNAAFKQVQAAYKAVKAGQPIPADVGQVTGGGGAQEPPGGPPGGPPPPGAVPPEPPLSAAQQLGQQTKRTLDQLKNIFAPQTRGPQARELATQIRGASGELTQLHEQARDVLNKHRDTENTMSQEDLRKLVNRAQGGDAFPDWKPNQAQQAELGDIKRVTDMWANKLGTLDRAKQMDWIKNYLPGMYKNADANPEFFQNMGRGQGGAGSLKQKTFPDYEAARAAGLEPLTNSPIEMLELYGSQMRKFIAKQEVMDKNLKSGTFIKSQPPERIGAAGSPEPQIKSKLPPNYIESKTSPGTYMPEEIVNAWDNFHAKGLAGGRNKDVYGALRSANAAWTNLELSLNGYHAFTMANESFISDVAMGIEKIVGGKVTSGLKTIAQAPYAPRGRALLGTKVQQSYLDPNSTDPITQSLVKAGFRPIGRSHAADSMLGQKTFLDSFKDLPKQLKQAASETQQGWTDANGDLLKQVAYPFRLAQRAIATASHPLFEVYIPKLKAGAAYAQMEHWREFNPDKIGTAAETEAARKIIDSVDNRFGEMITDHLFMNKVVQDSAVAGMRSFSWFMGSMKEIGGGTYSGARAVARAAIERDPSRLGVLNPTNKNYDPRTAYAVAMPMAIAATSAMYQALLGSHDAPESWRDLYAPRTGGMVAGPGGSRVQEHMLMPGYHKDVYGWLAHPGGEAYNKFSGVWSTAIEEARGRGSPSIGSPPFIRPNASFTENVTDRMSYLFSKLGPIGTKAFLKGQKEGSEIPGVMAAAGFHPPGMEIQAPEKIHAIQSKQEKREWKTMTKRANRDAMSRGQPLPYPAAEGRS